MRATTTSDSARSYRPSACTYEPMRAVYSTAASCPNLPPERFLMVAAHEEDARGARALGVGTAFLTRLTKWGRGAS